MLPDHDVIETDPPLRPPAGGHDRQRRRIVLCALAAAMSILVGRGSATVQGIFLGLAINFGANAAENLDLAGISWHATRRFRQLSGTDLPPEDEGSGSTPTVLRAETPGGRSLGAALFLAFTVVGLLVGRVSRDGDFTLRTVEVTTTTTAAPIAAAATTTTGPTTTTAGAPTLTTGTYLVTVRGSALGGAPFDLQGTLRVRPEADGSSKVCLKVGNPFAPSAPGEIWFGTRIDCFGNGPTGPMTTASGDGSTLVLSPRLDGLTDPKLSLMGFNVSNAITACWYVPVSGEVRLSPVAGGLSGAVNLRGLDACGSSAQAVYSSTLTANLLSTNPDAQASSPQPTGTTSPATALGLRYTVSTVTSFQMVEGSAAFANDTKTRVAGAVFLVDVDRGTFQYAPANSRDDIFPVDGTLTPTGDRVYRMTGSRQAGGGATAAATEVNGLLDLTGSQPLVQLTVTTTIPANRSSYQTSIVLARA